MTKNPKATIPFAIHKKLDNLKEVLSWELQRERLDLIPLQTWDFHKDITQRLYIGRQFTYLES